MREKAAQWSNNLGIEGTTLRRGLGPQKYKSLSVSWTQIGPTVLEFILKNHAISALRRELLSQAKFQNFKLSLTWLKGPINVGCFGD